MIFQHILKLAMTISSKHFISLCFLIMFLTVMQGQETWELVKEKQGIKVFTRQNEAKLFKEFKSIMQIKAEMSDFLAVLYDVEGLPKWAYNITESRLLNRPDPYNQTYYAIAKAPWPYKNRDGVYHNKISWDEHQKVLTIEIEFLEDTVEIYENLVRMDGYGFWMAKEIGDGELEITFQMQVDPGGAIKAWIANMFVSDSPYFTMKGLRDVIKEKEYQGHSYELLK